MASINLLTLFMCGFLYKYSYGLELVTVPESKMIPQGESYTLFCETDEPYEICKWSHVDQNKDCRVTSDEIEDKQGQACNDDSHLIWELTETSCGITIQNAARSDLGEYKCTLGVLSPEPLFLTKSGNIDVSVPAIVTFQGSFSESPHIELDLNTEAIVECHVTGGYPQPTIQAAIGHEKDHIDTEEADEVLEIVEEHIDELDDGTFEVTKSFKFTATEEHCGRFVKCEAVQRDEDENILFQEQDVMSRKLSIVFGPQPLASALQPFQFTKNAESVMIHIVFSANPVPNNNQAIWHINPTGNASTHSHVLQAGHSEEDRKYVALPLNNTLEEGHDVRACLIINNPTPEDLENLNYLEVATPKGSQRYDFVLEIVELPTPEPNDENTDGEKNLRSGDDDSETNAKGMGVGSVIAIVIVIAVVCLIIGCVVYSKRTGKCCFERYNSVPTKQPELAEEDINHHTDIIINGGKGQNKLVKAVEAGVDETDEQQKENPV